MDKNKIVTIDGETAAGKGTLAKQLAKNNSLYYLAAGQIFRAVGFLVLEKSITVEDAAHQFDEATTRYDWDGSDARLVSDGRDITPHLDEDHVASAASKLAKDTGNLAMVNALIRRHGEEVLQTSGIVCEGRNTSTALFPETDLAFYITASPDVRARRRHETHLRQGRSSDYGAVLEAMVERDHRDKSRGSFPLGPIATSVIIDTTDLAVSEALQTMQTHVNERGIA